jgi:hypothetical protein
MTDERKLDDDQLSNISGGQDAEQVGEGGTTKTPDPPIGGGGAPSGEAPGSDPGHIQDN